MRKHVGLYVVGLSAVLVLYHSFNVSAQVKVLPGSAVRGEQLLTAKGCVQCHSLHGKNGNRAPDLGSAPPHATSPELLASAMWNHATEMRLAQLTSAEAADLFAYFYSVLYFSLPADAARGKKIFESKGCAGCHQQAPTATADDPVRLAERMWNHSAEMKRATSRQKVQWPTLSDQDVADLTSYLRGVPGKEAKPSTFQMGEPERGQLTFEKTCESCHSFGPGLGKKIDLLERAAPRTVTGYIAAMWNHLPSMLAQNQAPLPALAPGEMSNLLAFLFSQSYFFQRGDVSHGRQVFESKGCVSCHEQRRKEMNAPDLTQVPETYSPITLISAISRHGPKMLQVMQQKGAKWPQFHGSEMTDLIAYLNSKLIPRTAFRAARH